jgi:hypothetical protein
MITRSHFNGIDRELFRIIELFFEVLSQRMIYHNNNDLFYEMEKRLTGYHELDCSIACEFKRYGEKVTIQLSNTSLDIKFSTSNLAFEDDTHAEVTNIKMDADFELDIYQYTYINNEDVPEIFEEGDFEYFSMKFHELYSGIDIDKIVLSKKA